MKYIELDNVKYNIFDNSTDAGLLVASEVKADIDVVLEDKAIEDIETAFKAVGSPLVIKENDTEIARYYGLTKLQSIELKEKTNDDEEAVRIATVHLTKPSLEATVEKNTSDIEELTNAIFALGAE
jgi:hypothetical protein